MMLTQNYYSRERCQIKPPILRRVLDLFIQTSTDCTELVRSFVCCHLLPRVASTQGHQDRQKALEPGVFAWFFQEFSPCIFHEFSARRATYWGKLH